MKPVAVISGVGTGLSRSTALKLGREGYAVALVARSQAAPRVIAEEIRKAGGEALSVQGDMTVPEQAHAAFDSIREALGPVQALIANAGGRVRKPFLELTPVDMRIVWEQNVMASFLAAQEVLPDMLRQGNGVIVFVGASASVSAAAQSAAFAGGKFGVRALAFSLAREFGPQEIHVAHIVIDGGIDTEKRRQRDPGAPAENFLAPDAIADTIFHLIQQDRSAWTLEMDLRPFKESF